MCLLSIPFVEEVILSGKYFDNYTGFSTANVAQQRMEEADWLLQPDFEPNDLALKKEMLLFSRLRGNESASPTLKEELVDRN